MSQNNHSPAEVDLDTGAVTERLLDAFAKTFNRSDVAMVVRAPGRVNLIGDHTDYNEGFVLPSTIDRDVFVALAPRSDERARISSLNFDDAIDYSLDDGPGRSSASWRNYVTGAVHELYRRDQLDCGFDMLIYGNVPLGAGLSSSAALEISVLFGLTELFEIGLEPIECIRIGQRVEHEYAGVQCGIMDQFTSRLGKSGHALYLDCRTLEYDHVPLPLAEAGLALLIVDSKVSRELANSEYGRRRSECDEAVRILKDGDDSIDSLRDVTIELAAHLPDGLEDLLKNRVRHVVEENDRVRRAREALRAEEYEEFGEHMYRSHESLRDLYEVSTPELDFLVAETQDLEGVLGARMTGGGFGGCTVNLVELDALDDLSEQIERLYIKEFDLEPEIYALTENHRTEVVYSD